MTPDLYQILGLPRDANAADIKAAFRRLAKDLHPDHGGDPEQFRRLVLAYDVLSDPDQRHHYDQTGEMPADTAEKAAEDAKFRALAGDLLVALITAGTAPQFTDFVALAENEIKHLVQQCDDQVASVTALAHRLEEARSRLHCKGDTNILADVLGERVAKLQDSAREAALQKGRLIRLQAMLRDYVYEFFEESLP